MKKLILTTLFFIAAIEIGNGLSVERFDNRQINNRVKFYPAYNLLRQYEGNYADHVFDKGKQTYGGITRKWNPTWYGWRYIDQQKPKANELVPRAEFWVLDYYLDLWVKEGWCELTDQTVANYLFEFRVHAGNKGISIIEKSINQSSSNKIKVDFVLQPSDIQIINTLPSITLLSRVRTNRCYYYYDLVRADSSQREFLPHWLDRARKINS